MVIEYFSVSVEDIDKFYVGYVCPIPANAFVRRLDDCHLAGVGNFQGKAALRRRAAAVRGLRA